MLITCQPKWSTKKSLSGELIVDGNPFGYFLTLPLGDGLPGSAIPPGTYSVTIGPSPKFIALAEKDAWHKIYMNQIPHLVGIPNRSNILVHVGNSVEQTDGCLLVGNTHSDDFIGASRACFAKLQPLIVAACLNPTEGCEITMLAMASNHDQVQEAIAG